MRADSALIIHSEVVTSDWEVGEMMAWAGGGGAWHMHLVYVPRQLRVGVVTGEQGGTGRENEDIQQERRKSHTIGSLQRTISSSPR